LSTASIRWFLGACAAALLAGCGGKVLTDRDGPGGGGEGGSNGSGGATSTSTGTSTDPAPAGVTPACLEYCESVTQVQGCFGVQDCHDRCMAIYVPECTPEVEAVLACLPAWLSDECQISYPYDPDEGCLWPEWDLFDCGFNALGGCTSTEGWPSGELGCTSETECPGTLLEIDCDEKGQCWCIQDDIPVGWCGMPFAGGEACSPGYHCCRELFAL
jgi:hypothetical protein